MDDEMSFFDRELAAQRHLESKMGGKRKPDARKSYKACFEAAHGGRTKRIAMYRTETLHTRARLSKLCLQKGTHDLVYEIVTTLKKVSAACAMLPATKPTPLGRATPLP